MPSVAQNTLFIQEGACNPRAMARELVRAVDEACDKGGSPEAGKSPAVRLILHQLFFVLFGTDLYLSDGLNQFPVLRDGKHGEKADWDKDMATVRALVEQEAARIVVERAEANLAAAQSAERYPGGTVGGVPKFNPENVAYVERSNSAAEE